MTSAIFEANLARRLVQRFGLTPPIDLAAIASRYASIEYRSIPQTIDGICLDLKRPGVRPTIIINLDRPKRRRRFTFAHELGHVLIPWHRGSLYDDFSIMDADIQFDRHEMEGEANRFASELLMPSPWAQHIVQTTADFGMAISLVQKKAEVSTIASVIRLIGLAEPNHIFALCDEAGTVLNAGRSPGTLASAPGRHDKLNATHLNELAERRGGLDIGATRVYWWKLPQEMALVRLASLGDWQLMLNEMLHNLADPAADRHSVRQSINGVIGATNSRMRGSSPEALLAALTQRFHSRATEDRLYAELVHHPCFRDFLVSRVEALRSTEFG